MRALAAVALAVLTPVSVSAQPVNARPRTEMRVYDLGLNDPAMAAEIIRGLLSPEGRVYPDPAQHRERHTAEHQPGLCRNQCSAPHSARQAP